MSVLLTFLIITIEAIAVASPIFHAQNFSSVVIDTNHLTLSSSTRQKSVSIKLISVRKIVYVGVVLCVHFVYASMAQHLFYFLTYHMEKMSNITSAYIANVFYSTEFSRSCFVQMVITSIHVSLSPCTLIHIWPFSHSNRNNFIFLPSLNSTRLNLFSL